MTQAIKFPTKSLLLIILVLALFLRVWRLDAVPISLFGDELDVGYQAYSILLTGHDYMGNFLPIHFQSLAEYRTPLYLYSAIPSVAIFGITPYGVRLPAAIFGVLGVWFFYLLVKQISKNNNLSLLATLLLAISPWHIHYSRAGFEITQMITLYILGLYFFLKGLENTKWLFFSAIALGLTPWVYNTAKLFLPLTLLTLGIIYFRQLKKISKKQLLGVGATFFLIVLPITWSTLFGGGSQRFEGISIFSDNTTIPKIGFERFAALHARDKDAKLGDPPSLSDRVFNNQFTSIGNTFLNNYLSAYSATFLFVSGETNNLRQSVPGQGVMYKVDFIFLLIGLYFFIRNDWNRRDKMLLVFLFLFSPLPAAITQNGGTHATRLMLLLPGFLLLVAVGIYYSVKNLFWKKLVITTIILIYSASLVSYQYQYWVFYPFASERWWHAGIKDAMVGVKQYAKSGEKIIISNADEPMLKFFLAWSQYPPDQFQKKYPLQSVELAGIGPVEKLDDYYFTKQGQSMTIYELEAQVPSGYYYLAPFKEIGLDLVKEPVRVPKGIKLINTYFYPSGDPAFYLLYKDPGK